MNVRTMRSGMVLMSAAILAAGLVSGCARTQAQVSPDIPALDVPLPPSRIIATASPEPPPLVGTPTGVVPSGIDELNRSDPPRQPAVTPRRVETRPAEPPKPEVAAAEPPKPADESRPPASLLQNTPPQREGEVEAAIRTDIRSATANLNRVDYQRLSSDARQQYDLAKGWLAQAEAALAAKNLPYAKGLAERAASVANQLGR